MLYGMVVPLYKKSRDALCSNLYIQADFLGFPVLFLGIKEESHKTNIFTGGILYDGYTNQKRDQLQKISAGAGAAALFWAGYQRTSRDD